MDLYKIYLEYENIYGCTAIYIRICHFMWGIDNLYGIYFIGGTAICMGVRNLICITTLYLGYDNVHGGYSNLYGGMTIYVGD
jgi:hypothetical protein